MRTGHSSIQGTEHYLDVELDLVDSPSDRVGLRLDEGTRPDLVVTLESHECREFRFGNE